MTKLKVKDVIEEILDFKQLMQPHVHVISNPMIFDSAPPHRCIGFHRPLIHILNKGAVAIKGTPFYSLAAHRPNGVLLGDALGDLQMGDGLDHDTLLTIGLLNEKVDSMLMTFSDKFDVVITHDSSLGWLQALLTLIDQ